MRQKYKFEGQYQRTGSTFKSSTGISIAVATRKNFTPSKPKEFLIYRTPEDQRGQFFSSIYPHPDGRYYADHNGQKYSLTFSNEGLMIEAE